MMVLFSGFTQRLQFNPAGQHALTDANRVLVPAEARTTHKIPDHEELRTIGKGGQAGLANIAGAYITWSDGLVMQITCAECYGRKLSGDPHAENQPPQNDSLPSVDATGIEKYVRIVVQEEGNYRRRLVLGTYDCTYLVTGIRVKSALDRDRGKTYLGPSRCASLVENRECGKLAILRDRANAVFLSEEDGLAGLAGLAQVRSHFGSPRTYTTRRAALHGFHCIERLPTTVFTITMCAPRTKPKTKDHTIRYSAVFERLFHRSKEATDGIIVLQREDISQPGDNETTRPAKYTRQLLQLFDQEEKLCVTNNDQAETLHASLAGCYYSEISKRNLQKSNGIK